MVFPLLGLLHPGYNRSRGAEAMLDCIPSHHLLAFLGYRSSFGQTQTICTTRTTHAAPPLIRDRSIASSPARVQLSSATRIVLMIRRPPRSTLFPYPTLVPLPV